MNPVTGSVFLQVLFGLYPFPRFQNRNYFSLQLRLVYAGAECVRGRNVSAVLVVLVILSSFSVLVTILPENVRGATLFVGGTGPGNYTTIQSAVDAAKSHDIVYVYKGTYHELVDITKALSLVGEDRDTTVINGSLGGVLIRVPTGWVDISNFTIIRKNGVGIAISMSDFTVVANNTILNSDIGIRISGSKNCIIVDNNLTSNTDGIMVFNSNNITLVSNALFHNSESGITLMQSGNSTLSNNAMVGNSIAISGSSVEYWNTHVIDTSNTVNYKPVYYWKNRTKGIVPQGAGEVIIANCTGVVAEHQNVSDGSVGIQIGFSFDSVITNNTISSHGSTGLYLYKSIGIVIANNNVSSNYMHGIGSYLGIYNVIFNNTVLHNRRNGLMLYESYRHIIVNNNLSLSGYDGLLLGGDSNLVANNTFHSSDKGIETSGTVDNRIFHNNFIANGIQAYSSWSITNHWDDGYPSGGNYWDDYTGSDMFSGPDQDQPGKDGIGDTPYKIPRDESADRYPQMSLCGVLLPRAPGLLAATLTGKDYENVTINWSLSPDDGSGFRTVTGYEVYRGTTYDTHRLGYQLVTFVSKGNTRFNDIQAGEGDPDDYFYRICAVDLGNNTVCSTTQAGKFARSLSGGPNLVSIPLIQSHEDTEAVFQTLEWDKAWTYNSSTEKWEWLMKFKPYLGRLKTVNHLMGLWVNVTQDSNMTVAGLVPLSTNVQLLAGWNLVGFPSFNTTNTVGDLKSQTGATNVEGFDASSPPYFLKTLNNTDVLLAGQGYWIYVPVDVMWTISNF